MKRTLARILGISFVIAGALLMVWATQQLGVLSNVGPRMLMTIEQQDKIDSVRGPLQMIQMVGVLGLLGGGGLLFFSWKGK